METVRNQALVEIVRVSKSKVIMIEPFRDFNQSGIKRDYIVANDYFSATIKDVEKFGLKKICCSSDFPNKNRLGVGFVIFDVL
jgi:hypothetical protein